MSMLSLRYKGYTIHTYSTTTKVSYQSPAWPADPRVVTSPSLETAKRWIREELRRIEKHGLKNAVYLARAREEIRRPPGRRGTYWVKRWRIINANKDDLVQPYFQTKDEAREFADKRGWALLEHLDY